MPRKELTITDRKPQQKNQSHLTLPLLFENGHGLHF